MEKRPILILGAMDVEVDYLISKIENCKLEEDIYKFYEGTINNYPVIIGKTSVGLIEASACTMLAIQKYNPIAIINEGTAGACTSQIHKNDIVIGEDCLNINSFLTPYKDFGEGSNSLEWELVNFATKEDFNSLKVKADSDLLSLAQSVEYAEGKVFLGTIGSSFIWNKEIDKIEMLNKNYGVLCEEMEGIAVYNLAQKYNIPVIGIRVISDNEILKEEYERNIGSKSQEFTYELAKKLIDWRENSDK